MLFAIYHPIAKLSGGSLLSETESSNFLFNSELPRNFQHILFLLKLTGVDFCRLQPKDPNKLKLAKGRHLDTGLSAPESTAEINRHPSD